jgi:DNA-binding SARP family transcriptional activator
LRYARNLLTTANCLSLARKEPVEREDVASAWWSAALRMTLGANRLQAMIFRMNGLTDEEKKLLCATPLSALVNSNNYFLESVLLPPTI